MVLGFLVPILQFALCVDFSLPWSGSQVTGKSGRSPRRESAHTRGVHPSGSFQGWAGHFPRDASISLQSAHSPPGSMQSLLHCQHFHRGRGPSREEARPWPSVPIGNPEDPLPPASTGGRGETGQPRPASIPFGEWLDPPLPASTGGRGAACPSLPASTGGRGEAFCCSF